MTKRVKRLVEMVKKKLAEKEMVSEGEKTVSLDYIRQIVGDPNTQFAVLGAQRGTLSDEENNTRHESLKEDINGLGYDYVDLDGGYREDQGVVKEDSLLVREISSREATRIAQKYDQESIIYKKKDDWFAMIDVRDNPGNVFVRFQMGPDEKKISTDSEDVKEFFSALKKGKDADKKFVFIPVS